MAKLQTTIDAAKRSAELLVYGPIGSSFWDENGISSKEFTEALNDIPKGTTITIGINSEGGSIAEGLAIFNAIKRRAEEITARIDGYALSAGSFIPLAAGKVISPPSAVWMIHNGWTMTQGNAADHRKQAETLEAHDNVLVDIYAAKTGKDAAEIAAALAAETWLSGAEAVDWGLADRLDGDTNDEAMDAVDLSRAPQGAFRISPAAAILAVAKRLANGEPHNSLPKATTASAQTKQRKESAMDTNTPAPVANEPTALDLTPVVDALGRIESKLDKPQPVAAAEPVAPRIENLGNPAIEKFNSLEFERVRQASFVRAHYHDLRNARRDVAGIKRGLTLDPFDFRNPQVMAGNTIDAGLANSLLSSDAITVMRTKIAPIMAFTRKIELSPVSKRQVINVPLVSSAGSVQTNASNYESGDTTAGDVAVTVNEISKSWHVARASQNLGLELGQLAGANAKVMGEGCMAVITALLDEAGTAIGAAGSMSTTVLKAILALATNFDRATLLLSGGHLAYLLPTDRDSFRFGEEGAYGFDGGIYKNNLWTGSVSNCCGLVTGPDSIAVAMGPPAELPAGEALSTETVTVVGDLVVQSTVWFSRASRALWGSYQVMFGAANGDETQRKPLVTS